MNPTGPSRTATGFVWLMAETVGSKAVSMGSQLLLAWNLLSPEDFGLFAMTAAARSVAELVASPGLRTLLIQRQSTIGTIENPVFWLSLCLGMLGGLVMSLFALVTWSANVDIRLGGMLLVVAAGIPAGSALIVPDAKLRSLMRFGAVAVVEFCGTVIVGVGALVLAWSGFGVYSLVIPLPVAALVKLAMAWRLSRPAVRWNLETPVWASLMADSLTLLGSRILTVLSANVDYLFLWLFSPTTAVLGNYFLAYNFSSQAIRLFSDNLVHVLMPSLVKSDSRPVQYASALRATRLLALLVIPVCVLQALVADPLIRTFFKPSYFAMIPVFQILSLGMAFRCVGAIANSLMNAQGRFRAVLGYDALLTALFCLLTALAAYWGGPFWVAAVVAINIVGRAVIFQRIAFQGSANTAWQMLAAFLGPAAAATVAGLVAFFGTGQLLDRDTVGSLVEVLVLTLVFAGIYLTLALLWMRSDTLQLVRHASGIAMRGNRQLVGGQASRTAV